MDERTKVIICFVTLIILGVPVWWKTTETYRAQLPHEDIGSLSLEQLRHFPWSINLDIVILADKQQKTNNINAAIELLKNNDNQYFAAKLQDSSSYYQAQFNVDISTVNIDDQITNLAKDSNGLDNFLLEKSSKRSDPSHYTFFIIPNQESSLKVHLGKYRHFWVFADLNKLSSNNNNGDQYAKSLLEIMSKSIYQSLISTSSNEDALTAVRPSTQYRLSFSLLNADPRGIQPTWEIKEAIQQYLNPFLNSVSPLADITIDSQVLHFTSLLKEPIKKVNGSNTYYYIPSNALPQYINPAEWKLDFVETSTQPLLNFILFVPEAGQTPLRIQKEDGSLSATNAFISPQWGGIVIYNPSNKSNNNHSNTIITAKDLHPVMEVFVGQLRTLLGLTHPSTSASTTTVVVPNTQNGIALWETDRLVRRYTFYNLNSTISTLQSLSRLVQNLTNMVVQDNIADLCQSSLRAVHEAQNALQQKDYVSALRYSKIAVDNAEEAFFDPNMLAMLYFPDEHKYAIYSLPFYPILFKVIYGVWTEYKTNRDRRILKTKVE